MKWKTIAWAAVVVSAVMIAGGQPLTVESAPFTFPVEVGVQNPGIAPRAAAYFRYSAPASRGGAVTFRWSFPSQPMNQKGTITVYSLLGRAVKTFPVAANEGRITWDISGQSVRGVYIARIVCGSARQDLKLLVCR
jgi:hypothetical protein